MDFSPSTQWNTKSDGHADTRHLTRAMRFAYIGVTLFFVISLTWNLLVTPNSAAFISSLITLHLLVGGAFIGAIHHFRKKLLYEFRLRRSYETALHAEEEYLHQILDHVADGVAVFDVQGVPLYLNATAYHLFQSASPKPQLSIPEIKNKVFNAQGKRALKNSELPQILALNGKRVQGLELSLYDLDTNQRISLLANSQPLMGNDGHLEAVVVTYHDITANKRAESELRLAASAFEVPESMFITNHSGIIQHVNQEFSTMTGYKPDELVGSDSEILASEHHSNDFYVEMMKTLESAGRWEGELWCKRKDQKQQPLWAKITSIQTEKDKESYYLVSMVDLNTHRHDWRVHRIRNRLRFA